MNGRLTAGLAAFFSVGAVLWLPYGASARQTMIGTTTAAGVAGDLNSRAGANGMNAKSRAAGVANKAKGASQFEDDSQVPARTPGGKANNPASPPQRSIYDPREIAARLSEPARLKEVQGHEFGIMGMVGKFIKMDDGSQVIQLLPAPQMSFPEGTLMMVKMTSEIPVQEGQVLMLTGRLVSSKLGDDGQVQLLAFDKGEVMREPGGGNASSGTAPANANPSSPTDGWELIGLAQMNNGGTCVFVRENEVIYLRKGDELRKGLKVTSIGLDGVTLSTGKEQFSLVAG